MPIYLSLVEADQKGQSVALCTITDCHGSTPRHVGSKMLVYEDGRNKGAIGGEMESRVIQEALAALGDGEPRNLEYSMRDPQKGDPGVCGGTIHIFIEPIKPKPILVVVGGGHVGQAVARFAKWMDYRVVVSDDRADFANEESVPDADDFHHGPLAELPEKFTINPQTYLVLTTRNVMIDAAGLPALLDTPAAYIGVIGSKRRWNTTRKMLIDQGLTKDSIARVVSPMGFEINAETPEEIAISILAEIIMLRRGGDGTRMSE